MQFRFMVAASLAAFTLTATAQMPDTLRQRCVADAELDAAESAKVAQIVAGALASFKP